MFVEYMTYASDKTILRICENTVYVKILPCLDSLMDAAENGCPYKSTKEHDVLDIYDRKLAVSVVTVLKPVINAPKPQKNESGIVYAATL